jgi:hypothetical protein
VLEDLFDDILILHHTDYFHLAGAFWASWGINLIDFLNQSGRVARIFF